MNETLPNPDYLKPRIQIHDADVRARFFNRYDGNGFRPDTLDDHHNTIAGFNLADAVPDAVRTQFETAKNLYLYAWFVFRFYPVAERQALSCLEFGLRERFPAPLPRTYWNKKYPPTLGPLLRYAVDQKAISNEGFRVWRDRTERLAVERYRQQRREEMIEKNLMEIELSDSEATVIAEDRNWDYLGILVDVLPAIRNHHAHGSSSLSRQVLGTFELVGEILDQLFASPSSSMPESPEATHV
jgi:hypothetical protein